MSSSSGFVVLEESQYLIRAEAAQHGKLLEGVEASIPGLWQGHLMGFVAVQDGLEVLCLLCNPCGKALHTHAATVSIKTLTRPTNL